MYIASMRTFNHNDDKLRISRLEKERFITYRLLIIQVFFYFSFGFLRGFFVWVFRGFFCFSFAFGGFFVFFWFFVGFFVVEDCITGLYIGINSS